MLYMSEMHTACLASRLTCTHFMIHSSHEHSNCAIGGADYRSSCPNACAAVTLCVCLIGLNFYNLTQNVSCTQSFGHGAVHMSLPHPVGQYNLRPSLMTWRRRYRA